ncbi:MAG TPA: BamA/TamA family outer membrane protein [Vicinamibacterales bacterium]|nr:BamA/TamA family outer membrane protein [Vicinamibacterales bacterium]
MTSAFHRFRSPARHSTVSVLLLLALAPGLAPVAAAQSTRAEAIEQQQAEKATSLRPPQPSLVEQKFLEIEEAGGFGVQRGLFVTVGGIKSGSSVAMGPVYGRTFASGALAQAKVVYSVRNFKLAEALVQSAPLAGRRLVVGGRVRWQDAPVLAVYPFGTASQSIRADYAETMTEFSTRASLRPVRFLFVEGSLGYERFETRPSDTDRPSVEEVYTPEQLPGLDADPHYLHTTIAGSLDTTTGPGYSRSGTVLAARFHDYRQQNDGAFSFQRTDAIARQLIPILHGNWVIDLSARLSTTSPAAGDQVPYFLMPSLGGGRNLRGYSSYRFRDRHTLVVTAEYRWYAQEWVDMALYYDAGKAVARRADLNLQNMRNNVGIGIRFHTPGDTALRLEVAAGNEGLHYVIGWGPIFRP